MTYAAGTRRPGMRGIVLDRSPYAGVGQSIVECRRINIRRRYPSGYAEVDELLRQFGVT